MPSLRVLPCLDSDELAAKRRIELQVSSEVAADLGSKAVQAVRSGLYADDSGGWVEWHDAVRTACQRRVSIPPDVALPVSNHELFDETRVQVLNQTTLGAARDRYDAGERPLALNFANGVHPCGGFLVGARAQEETLCRSSALYETLRGDPMYETHARRSRPDSTDWAILSPDVPVFRRDDGSTWPEPWPLSIITCAAPVAQRIGQPEASDLLRRRIHRVLSIARAYGYSTLVLGAWGCGAFGNDPARTARDFWVAQENDFCGAFADIVFAITDWSPDRRFLGPFRDVFTV